MACLSPSTLSWSPVQGGTPPLTNAPRSSRSPQPLQPPRPLPRPLPHLRLAPRALRAPPLGQIAPPHARGPRGAVPAPGRLPRRAGARGPAGDAREWVCEEALGGGGGGRGDGECWEEVEGEAVRGSDRRRERCVQNRCHYYPLPGGARERVVPFPRLSDLCGSERASLASGRKGRRSGASLPSLRLLPPPPRLTSARGSLTPMPPRRHTKPRHPATLSHNLPSTRPPAPPPPPSPPRARPPPRPHPTPQRPAQP